MSINILDVDINNLKQAKYKAMKEHIIGVLDKVKDLVERGDYEELEEMTFFSPSGDCMGCDNHCINFTWRDDEDMDIDYVVQILKRLDSERAVK